MDDDDHGPSYKTGTPFMMGTSKHGYRCFKSAIQHCLSSNVQNPGEKASKLVFLFNTYARNRPPGTGWG